MSRLLESNARGDGCCTWGRKLLVPFPVTVLAEPRSEHSVYPHTTANPWDPDMRRPTGSPTHRHHQQQRTHHRYYGATEEARLFSSPDHTAQTFGVMSPILLSSWKYCNKPSRKPQHQHNDRFGPTWCFSVAVYIVCYPPQVLLRWCSWEFL